MNLSMKYEHRFFLCTGKPCCKKNVFEAHGQKKPYSIQNDCPFLCCVFFQLFGSRLFFASLNRVQFLNSKNVIPFLCMVALFFFSLRLSKASRRQKWRLHDSLTLQIYQLKAFLAQSLYAARIYPQFYIQLVYKVTLSFTLKFKWQPILSQKSSKIQKQN